MKIFLLPLAALLLAACSGGAQDGSSKEGPAQKAQGVLISESEKGASNWLLRAKEAEFFNEPGSYALLNQPHLIFSVKGIEDSQIRSNEGRYDMQGRLITLTGSVVGNSVKEGAKIKTEKIYYDMNTKKIWTDVNVTLTRAGVTVKGKGLRANSDFSEIELTKQATMLPKTREGLGANLPKAAK